MQHLRNIYTTFKPVLSLAKFCCESNASRTSQTACSLVSRQCSTSSLVGSQQTLFGFSHSSLPHLDCWTAGLSGAHVCLVSNRGFASQSASRLKQSVTRAKRIAQQQHGGRGGAVTSQADPTSNEAIETIPQDQSSVQASQSQASQLQVCWYCALNNFHCLPLNVSSNSSDVSSACAETHDSTDSGVTIDGMESFRMVPLSDILISYVQVQDVVGHPALVITRNVEWGTVIFGFEQANKYTIYDQEGNVVALLAEELGSFGKEVGRQLLRTRRPFTATVFSPDGRVPHCNAGMQLM